MGKRLIGLRRLRALHGYSLIHVLVAAAAGAILVMASMNYLNQYLRVSWKDQRRGTDESTRNMVRYKMDCQQTISALGGSCSAPPNQNIDVLDRDSKVLIKSDGSTKVGDTRLRARCTASNAIQVEYQVEGMGNSNAPMRDQTSGQIMTFRSLFSPVVCTSASYVHCNSLDASPSTSVSSGTPVTLTAQVDSSVPASSLSIRIIETAPTSATVFSTALSNYLVSTSPLVLTNPGTTPISYRYTAHIFQTGYPQPQATCPALTVTVHPATTSSSASSTACTSTHSVSLTGTLQFTMTGASPPCPGYIPNMTGTYTYTCAGGVAQPGSWVASGVGLAGFDSSYNLMANMVGPSPANLSMTVSLVSGRPLPPWKPGFVAARSMVCTPTISGNILTINCGFTAWNPIHGAGRGASVVLTSQPLTPCTCP